MLVFGHRGAPAYRPENTMESLELALTMNVDALECDIVPTKDGHLVLRHEADLSHTTDVLDHPEFAGRIHSTELTLAEIQTLRAKERMPNWRPGSAKFDGQFRIPTLKDFLNSEMAVGQTLILEVKDAPNFLQQGIDIVSLFADVVEETDIASRRQFWLKRLSRQRWRLCARGWVANFPSITVWKNGTKKTRSNTTA